MHKAIISVYRKSNTEMRSFNQKHCVMEPFEGTEAGRNLGSDIIFLLQSPWL